MWFWFPVSIIWFFRSDLAARDHTRPCALECKLNPVLCCVVLGWARGCAVRLGLQVDKISSRLKVVVCMHCATPFDALAPEEYAPADSPSRNCAFCGILLCVPCCSNVRRCARAIARSLLRLVWAVVCLIRATSCLICGFRLTFLGQRVYELTFREEIFACNHCYHHSSRILRN